MPARKLDRTPTAEAIQSAALWGCNFVMLGHGKFALIDAADAKWVYQWTWHFNKRGYAARLRYRGKDKCDAIIYLHRAIMGEIDGVEYDHINRDKLDCRRVNLRVCTQHQNAGNVGKKTPKRPSTSQFKGVSWDSGKKKWLAQGRNHGRMVFLGRFNDEMEAAKKYNEWASKHFGEFAYLNAVEPLKRYTPTPEEEARMAQ